MSAENFLDLFAWLPIVIGGLGIALLALSVVLLDPLCAWLVRRQRTRAERIRQAQELLAKKEGK